MSEEIQRSEPGPLDLLSTHEAAAYQLSIKRKEPFLSATLAEQLYNLFQAGKTCDEIQAVNSGLSLGSIVRARIDYQWDKRREEHLLKLLERARGVAQQIHLESLEHLASYLAVFHKADQAKFQRFLQTGDVEELNGTMLTSRSNMKLYKEVLELVLKLGGTEPTKPQKVEKTVTHVHVDAPVPLAARPMTPEQAHEALLALKPKRE